MPACRRKGIQSPDMHTCPHCHNELDLRELQKANALKFNKYSICPHCGNKFTVDPDTKTRQVVTLLIAVVTLFFTLMGYFRDTTWFIPTLISGTALALYIYRANKWVEFVPFRDDINPGRTGPGS